MKKSSVFVVALLLSTNVAFADGHGLWPTVGFQTATSSDMMEGKTGRLPVVQRRPRRAGSSMLFFPSQARGRRPAVHFTRARGRGGARAIFQRAPSKNVAPQAPQAPPQAPRSGAAGG